MPSVSETETIASPGMELCRVGRHEWNKSDPYLVVEAISFVNTGVTTAGCKKTMFNAEKWPPNRVELQLPRMILQPAKKMLQPLRMVHGVGKKNWR